MAGPIKFLLVDDIPENLVALEALLRRDGLELLCAQSGNEALELLLVHDFALALIDVNMPEMDGFELAELMRGVERLRHVPIIFVTAASRESQRVFRGYESGAVDFLFKPIDPTILRHKTEIFYELFRQRQELAEQMQRAQQGEARLRRVMDELEQAVHIRDNVLAIVSHDLRNPLNVIGLTTSLLDRIAHQRQDEQLIKHSGTLKRSVSRMERMIGDLLDMANLRTGRLSINAELQPLQTLLDETMAAHEPLAAGHGIRLRRDSNCEMAMLTFDKERMLQVFSNLIGNALKFCEPGATITVCAAMEAGAVRLGVVDTGPGIASDDLPHLFDAYWSADRDRKRGTGLGLYITRGIIEAHGGGIWVESTPGAGTAFWFTLPLPDGGFPR